MGPFFSGLWIPYDRAAAGGGAGSRGVGEAAREEGPEALGARGDRAAAGEVADPRFAGEDARGRYQNNPQ